MKRCSMLFAMALLFVFFTLTACAQDVDVVGGRSVNVFAEFSTANLGQGDGFIWGASAGGYVQGHVLGWVLRGTAEPGGDSQHFYNAVVGPRIAIDLPIVKPFFEAAGGVGHSNYVNSAGNPGGSWGAAWQIDAGIEHGLFARLRWRVVEVAYGHIYAGPGVSPTVISTGLSLHVF
jgi:hypothetical protein